MATKTPMDETATVRDTIITRAMITALGRTLVKSGVIDSADVLTELANFHGSMPDKHAELEIENVMKAVQNW